MNRMNLEIIEEGKFKYIETGKDKDKLMLLHGLFGALSNFEDLIESLSDRYDVVVPLLPLYDLPIISTSISGLLKYVEEFVRFKGYDKVHVLGNSLGGHIAILYALGNQDKVASLILTGSSGLFEDAMGSSFPKRSDYDFIKRKTESTFYDPSVASKELVDEVFSIVNDRNKAIRVLSTAKSAIRHNVGNRLGELNLPCLLIWGNNDTITPPFVGEKFHELINNSELHFIDYCGHAPMMERPAEFNTFLVDFLSRVKSM
jgi:2-hydroxy-6-oxonona-2,4-dienedioate hydrolase